MYVQVAHRATSLLGAVMIIQRSMGDNSTVTFFFLMRPGSLRFALEPVVLRFVSYVFMSLMKSYYSCSKSYRFYFMAASVVPFLILKSGCAGRLPPRPRLDEAGRCVALVCAHDGQTLANGFLSFGCSGSCGSTPANISYICRSFVMSYRK